MLTPEELLATIRRLAVIEEAAVPAVGSHVSAEELAAAWVNIGLLTEFQRKTLLSGKGERLRIGPYLLLDRIGRGGMGEVFRARHVRLGREAALKIIRQDKLESAVVAARFLRELQATAKVEHPNVVRVFNAGRDSRHLYFSMDYVRGATLAEIVRRNGPLPISEACRAIADAALGLQAVHDAGLVHRDVKPANLMREDATGRTKVLDLGLAGLSSHAPEDVGIETITISGTVLGTPEFMAPEQARDAHQVDHRSDLYALGCTLFTLLTGKPVFAGRTPVATMCHHAFTPPPDVRIARPQAPAELAAVVARLLAKSPAERWQSASALAAALAPFATQDLLPATASSDFPTEELDIVVVEPFAFQEPVETTERSRAGSFLRRRSPIIVLFGCISTIVAVVGSIHYLGRGTDAAPFVPEQVAVAPQPDKTSALRDRLNAPGADPAQLRSEAYRLHAELRSGPQGTAAARLLRSISSRTTAFQPLGDGAPDAAPVARWHAPGPRHWGPAHDVAVSPNGELVATVGGDRLVRLWSAETGAEIRSHAGFDDPVYRVAFSPDGRKLTATSLLLNVSGTEGFERKARTWDTETGRLIATFGADLDWLVSWRYSPDGATGLAGTYDRLHLRDAKTGGILKVLVAKNGSTNWIAHADFSRDGKHAIAACNDFQIHVWNLESGEEVRSWRAADWYDMDFDVCRANDEVLTVAQGNLRIWNWTTGAKQLEQQFDPTPTSGAFSPDGKRVFLGHADGRVRLFDRETGRRGETATGHDGSVAGIAWASSGKRVFSVGADGVLRRWDVTGAKPIEIDRPPTVRPATALAFGDEDRTLCVVRPDRPPEFWKLRTEPPPMIDVPYGATRTAAIAPDGRTTVVTETAGAFRVAIDTSDVRAIAVADAGKSAAVAWLPDGRRFLVAPSDAKADLLIVDASTGKVSVRLAPASDGVEGSPVVSGDGRWVAAGLRNGNIAWWDLTTGKPIGEVLRKFPDWSLGGLSFHPAHRHLRAFGVGWQVQDIPVGALQLGRSFWKSESIFVACGTVSADGSQTVLSTKSGEVMVVSELGKIVRTWTLPGRATALALSTDGRTLAVAQADGGIALFRMP